MSLLCFAAYKSIDERDNNNLVDCNFDELKPGQGQYCKVKANDLMKESCTHETNYGFETGTPCLLLKLNRVSHQGPAGARGHICELVLFISKLPKFLKFVNDIMHWKMFSRLSLVQKVSRKTNSHSLQSKWLQ